MTIAPPSEARAAGPAAGRATPSAIVPWSRAHWLTFAIATAALLAIAVRLAWLGDDAYITLRSVENWASGHGLRWNPDDRVQTYTHPLWMLLLTLGRVVSGEVYFTTLTISLVLSMAFVVALLWRARTVPAMVATAALLVAGRAFGDYMTSGLETPLTFVLLLAFVAVVLGEREAKSRYTRAVLLASLLATNRMDLALLCLPPVLSTMRGLPIGVLCRRGVLAALPFLGWLAFAGIYYGSPLPVTAHAKAFGIGIPVGDIVVQGLRYLWHAAVHDPALLVTVVVGGVGLLFRARTRWLALGALLYVGYVVKVGGDFMQGRFLLPPFVVVVAGLSATLSRCGWRGCGPVAISALALLLAAGMPAFLRSPAADTPLTQAVIDAQHGIIDERRMYYRDLGLMSPGRAPARFGTLEAQVFPAGRASLWWLLNGAVGSAGFSAGADCHVVDPLLSDPLIARLPARNPSSWRIGHVLRRIPEGYWESLRSGENQILHPGLRRYYEALRTLTQAPVFASYRLGMLWRMALGRFDADLRAFVADHYYDPPRVTVAAADLTPELPLGIYWFDEPQVHIVYEGGLAVPFGATVAAKMLRLQTLGLCAFRCRFVRAGEVVGEALAVPTPPPDGLSGLRLVAGLRTERVVVPAGVESFDELWIDFVETEASGKAVGPAGVAAVILE